ncbi:MAG: hypothetical protein KDK03_12950 [Rhodobacteraceae bacterium]|uniref:transporter n=1 Tax=Amaricoccus sp. B4 TaxID=3368557 RepID=UPI000DAC1D83|nr:hypothetical protein [Paracoccaceae bacterium]
MNGVALVLGIVVLNVTGDYFLKLASDRIGPFATAEFGLGAACYAFSAVGVLYALRHMPVAVMGVWYSVLSVLLLAALGLIVFEEKLAPREMLGLAMAVGSLFLMRRFI